MLSAKLDNPVAIKQTIIAGVDKYLSTNISRIVGEEKLGKAIRTSKIERIIDELKAPGRLVIVDMSWEEIQFLGTLKQFVNIGNISGNYVVCVCGNQEEDQKKLAKAARPAEVFIRFDLETRFREFLRTL